MLTYNIIYKDVEDQQNKQLDDNKKVIDYVYLDETNMITLYNQLKSKIKPKKIYSENEFKNIIMKFNNDLKKISIVVHNSDKEYATKYIKKLLKINNLKSNIIYIIFNLVKNDYDKIIKNKYFKIKKETKGGGKMCDYAILATDIAGMIPGAGIPIDIAGVVLSLLCGDYFGAMLGVVSIIPVAGWASGGIEIIRGLITIVTSFSSDDEDEDDDEEWEDE